MCFRYKAVIIWKEIDKNICVDIKIGTFKQYLKSYNILHFAPCTLHPALALYFPENE